MEDRRETNKVYSKRVRAGRRTYFFDIKPTKSNDYYLTITERKRAYDDEGGGNEKFKIFLYKEDLNKFSGALEKAVAFIKEELLPDYDFTLYDKEEDDMQTYG